jgi:hypothetical protein
MCPSSKENDSSWGKRDRDFVNDGAASSIFLRAGWGRAMGKNYHAGIADFYLLAITSGRGSAW